MNSEHADRQTVRPRRTRSQSSLCCRRLQRMVASVDGDRWLRRRKKAPRRYGLLVAVLLLAWSCGVFSECFESSVMGDESQPKKTPAAGFDHRAQDGSNVQSENTGGTAAGASEGRTSASGVSPNSASEEQDRAEGGGIPTLGGRQFWGDVAFFQGWRIQHHVIRDSYRLLDPHDRRHASGTQEECRDALKRIIASRKLPPMQGRAVILIHGIGRSSHCFSGMGRALKEDGYTVVRFDYPSTRVPIEASAEYLHSVVESLEGIDQIDVVCHSMGGLVLRAHVMKYREPRFRRAVLLGVPNRGAEMADMLRRNVLFRLVMGPAGQQLTTDPEGLINRLPVPDFEFAVIAGGRGTEKGYNPILPSDNDGTVCVPSTRLPGAADFLLVPVLHSFLMTDKRCIEATRSFLKNGRLVPDREPQPILPEDVAVPLSPESS